VIFTSATGPVPRLSLFMIGAILWLGNQPASASNPSSGTLTDANPQVTYTAGPFVVPNATDVTGAPTCDATIPAEQCDSFALTVSVPPADANSA
jgi:hypothetical protein